jgi:hypothetical protein
VTVARTTALVLALSTALAGACGSDAPAAGGSSGSSGEGSSGESGGVPDDRATIVHSFGATQLAGLEETEPCMSWTLENEQALYVQTVRLVNDGASHHSNWFAVPDTMFDGPDGYWDCDDRGFSEIEAAVGGTVLFAQSTQSRLDEQVLPEGVVVKIPPRHRIVAGGHFLNLSTAAIATEMRMSLEIIHPRDVQVVVAPFRLTYYALDIPAHSEVRFTGECAMSDLYSGAAGKPFDLKLYFVTPHYHYLGNYFELQVLGGPNDGQQLFVRDGFDGDSHNGAFMPAVDLTGADGFRFTCGFDNWTDMQVGWGIGDQEMCVMLGLADSAVLMDATVGSGAFAGEADGRLLHEGPCDVIGLPKNAAQTLPTADEIAAPLYVPPSDPGDTDLPPVPPCENRSGLDDPGGPATLSSIRDTLFAPSCSFSSCHGTAPGAAGLDLRATDLHAELLGHDVQAATALPLVAPGDPDGSWLMRLISQCEPTDDAGNVVAHMPRNAPTLADPALVARVRAWIAAGAPND